MAHAHQCGGCGTSWPCANAACTDLPTQACGCGRALPQSVEWTRGLEDSAHTLNEAAFIFRRKGRVAEAAGCERVRQALLVQTRRLARQCGLPVDMP